MIRRLVRRLTGADAHDLRLEVAELGAEMDWWRSTAIALSARSRDYAILMAALAAVAER